MTSHLRRWGAAYILAALFVASFIGQFVTQSIAFTAEQAQHGQAFEWGQFLPEFGASVLENLQSEWAQLLVQAVLISALADRVFRRSLDDHKRLEGKVDELLRR
jgi:hypothetical protein